MIACRGGVILASECSVISISLFYSRRLGRRGGGVGCGVKGNLDSIFPRISDSERNVNEFADCALAAVCGFDQFLGPNFGLCL